METSYPQMLDREGLTSVNLDNTGEKSTLKLSGVSMLWEYAKKNFWKLNLVLVVVLFLEYKGPYFIPLGLLDNFLRSEWFFTSYESRIQNLLITEESRVLEPSIFRNSQ